MTRFCARSSIALNYQPVDSFMYDLFTTAVPIQPKLVSIAAFIPARITLRLPTTQAFRPLFRFLPFRPPTIQSCSLGRGHVMSFLSTLDGDTQTPSFRIRGAEIETL